jgi:hypothetical protein
MPFLFYIQQVSYKSALLFIRLGAAQEVTGLRYTFAYIHLEFNILVEFKWWTIICLYTFVQ